ncbi:General substrate transporter [Corchorus capsularis]|uniref:General substrate transporter n=1 Tax=Corchorus capsularis TaxID=210143 RepID=A0A1R3J3Q7_COCAP|nr:General substrate transporter [Corchorus capsularis]
MADSTPLLSHYDESSEQKQKPRSLDDTIERCIGDFGWSQFLQAILVSLAWVFDAQQTFISVFTDAEPSWHCSDQSSSSSTICNSLSNICQLPKDSWSWDLPLETSIISEWGLECSSSFVTGLPASSFFMGCLIGGLVLATLADSTLGRKNMLFFSCLMMSLSSLLTVFSSNVWIYSALRFVNGFGRATIGTCALVLSTELVGKRWRGQVGVIGFFCFTLGFLSLPLLAYINRGSSWRNLYLWSSIPTILYCILVRFIVHESPRWLFVRGRKEEAVSTLKSMAAGQSILTMSFSNVPMEQESWNVDIYSTIKILLNKRWAFKRLAAVMVAGFGVGMVYYGMPLGLGNLSFNLYLSVAFNALSELPSSLITFFLIGKLSRKWSLVGFTILSGICSVLCVVVGRISPVLEMGLELVSFFSACSAFNIELIYTLELFPTCVRNSAISMVRQALVFGGVFSPVLVAAGRKNSFLSFGVFGVVIGLCGLPALGLPETKGETICDTLDEEEHKELEKKAAAAGSNNAAALLA